jgi:hypothetical protein
MERSRSCSPIGTQIRQRSGTPRRPPHLAASTQNSSLLGRPSPPRTLSRFVRSLLWSPPRLPDARSQRPGHPVSGRGEPDSSPSSDRRMGTARGRERPSLAPRLPAERDRPPSSVSETTLQPNAPAQNCPSRRQSSESIVTQPTCELMRHSLRCVRGCAPSCRQCSRAGDAPITCQPLFGGSGVKTADRTLMSHSR